MNESIEKYFSFLQSKKFFWWGKETLLQTFVCNEIFRCLKKMNIFVKLEVLNLGWSQKERGETIKMATRCRVFCRLGSIVELAKVRICEYVLAWWLIEFKWQGKRFGNFSTWWFIKDIALDKKLTIMRSKMNTTFKHQMHFHLLNDKSPWTSSIC